MPFGIQTFRIIESWIFQAQAYLSNKKVKLFICLSFISQTLTCLMSSCMYVCLFVLVSLCIFPLRIQAILLWLCIEHTNNILPFLFSIVCIKATTTSLNKRLNNKQTLKFAYFILYGKISRSHCLYNVKTYLKIKYALENICH